MKKPFIVMILLSLTLSLFVFNGCSDKKESAKTVPLQSLRFDLCEGEDGKYYRVSQKEINISGRLVIPTTYEGLPVKEVAFFNYCKDITELVIPSSVEYIDFIDQASVLQGTFSNGIESISVDKNNRVYESVGNCIIEKSTKTLILGCNGAKIPADGSVLKIGYNSFYGCEKIKEIKIPRFVTEIGKTAFEHCAEDFTIYCEIEESEKPSGWCENWDCGYPVVWGYKG